MIESASEPPFDVELTGCRPEPLASYLKALGVLRAVAEQKDAAARGAFRGEAFVLRSMLDGDALARFFSEEWRPTPVVAPWNGGSGFYPKDNREAADAILASTDGRLAPFAAAITVARAYVAGRGWSERPADEDKQLLISAMRAELPDDALAWIDAAVVLGDDRLMFPPLLGTGGNDGRLDFSNNFQQRVVEVIAGRAPGAVESALFGTTRMTRFKGAMGQYQPAASERTNPWDFVLLIEGALMFAATATRRYESASPSVMAFPFHARASGGLSTVTDTDESESRDEVWLPLWSAPATIREVRRLFAEGRATVGSGARARPAASALDFARAVSALGVDRGIETFVRIGFHVRNGLAYYATPLGRFAAREVPAARLLDDIDRWVERFLHKTKGKNVPARVTASRRRLEQALFEAAGTGRVAGVLLRLGEVEAALARSLPFTAKSFLGPVPHLPSSWASAVSDGSVEQRLAASLASRRGMRARLLPLDETGRSYGRGDSSGVVFTERPLIENLHALLFREHVESLEEQGEPPSEPLRARCSLTDIAQFIEGTVDDVLIERWLRALVLLEGELTPELNRDGVLPRAAYAVLALVHHRRIGDEWLPRTVEYLPRACAGDAEGATRAAIRRLNASARPLPVAALTEPANRMRRIAAALAFPLTRSQRRTLESMVLPSSDNADTKTVTPEPPQEQA